MLGRVPGVAGVGGGVGGVGEGVGKKGGGGGVGGTTERLKTSASTLSVHALRCTWPGPP